MRLPAARPSRRSRARGQSHSGVPKQPYGDDLRFGPLVELGYTRVSTVKQDLDRQVDAMQQAAIAPERMFPDKNSGATTDRPGLHAALAYARGGDVIVVHTMDRLGRTVRDTPSLITNLAEPIKVDSINRTDPMAQLAL